jgi:hypothetical protein
MKKLISILLAVVLVATVFAGCGKKNETIEKAQVSYPVPTDTQAVVDTASGLAVNYYLTGRAYLDEFLNYDVSTLTQDNYSEYTALVDNAVKAFENAEKANNVLNKALDVYEKEEKADGPKAQMLNAASCFGMVANAAEMGSKEWAQSIMDEYAKAKPGQAIRHLASQLGTDAKHAYAQMKMAQDILMGAEYTQIADKANTAVKTATVLKTAGTTAGLVIAVATAPASGAIATAVSTGGITISGVNTVLEIGSTASILYTNGEDNEFSMACDKTEAQLAPIGQIFAIAGVGANIKDLASAGKDIFKNGYKSLSPQAQQDLGMNTFGVISYGAGAITDYVNGGSIMSGTFTKGDDGVKFTLVNTLTGTDPEQQKNVKTVLKEAGISEKDAEAAIKAAEEATATLSTTAASGEQTTAPANEAQPTMNVNDIQPEVAQNIINNNKKIMDDFDLDEYLKKLREILYEIAEEAYGEEYEELKKNGKGDFIDTICGTYSISGTEKIINDTVYFDETGSQEAPITLTATISDAGNQQVNLTLTGEDGEGDTVTAKVDEANRMITFRYPYGYGYYYEDCNITFTISGDDISITLHMYGEGEDWKGETVGRGIDGSGSKL